MACYLRCTGPLSMYALYIYECKTVVCTNRIYIASQCLNGHFVCLKLFLTSFLKIWLLHVYCKSCLKQLLSEQDYFPLDIKVI